MRTTSLPHSTIVFRDDHILHIDYIEDFHFTIKESKEIFAACRELCHDIEKYPLLLTSGLRTSTDSEFRAHNTTKEVLQHCTAMAIVVNSLANVIIVNFFIKFNKPSVPTKFFNSKEKALEWLKNFETIHAADRQAKESSI